MQLICTKINHVSSLLAHYIYRFGVLETYQRRYFQSLVLVSVLNFSLGFGLGLVVLLRVLVLVLRIYLSVRCWLITRKCTHLIRRGLNRQIQNYIQIDAGLFS